MNDSKYNECGRAWAEAARKREAMDRHDQEHSGDPKLYWGECEICAERVEQFDRTLDKMIDANIQHWVEEKHNEKPIR